jgi:hypothetical protein
MRLALLAAAGVCVFFTAKELFPGRMSPNSLFSEAFEYLQYKEEVRSLTPDDFLTLLGTHTKIFAGFGGLRSRP